MHLEDGPLHKLLLQSLGVHLRGLVSVFTQESGF